MDIKLKYILFLLLLVKGLTACNQNNPLPDVRTISAMKKVMTGEDLSAHLNWNSIPRKHLFAVAPLGRVQGEVSVIDGKMYSSQVDSTNEISINNDWNIQSPFAVYATVSEWETFEIDKPIQSEDELQTLIEQLASENGYDLSTAFPFRVLGTFSTIDYHIISKPIEEIEHNHELHKKAKKHFHLKNTTGELLGFYSQNHEGIFTHKGHFIHTHFIDEERKNMGHLEKLIIASEIKILLPKI